MMSYRTLGLIASITLVITSLWWGYDLINLHGQMDTLIAYEKALRYTYDQENIRLHVEVAELQRQLELYKEYWKESLDGRCHPDLLENIDKYRPSRVPIATWRRLIWVESRCLPWAHNDSGAVGLAGVMNGPMDPDENLQEGAKRLDFFLNEARGDLEVALSMYGGWYKRIIEGGVWTNEYAKLVMKEN